MKKVLIFFLALTACATSSEIMSEMVGKPIQTAMIRRGNPDNAFDMPNGTRAFQWSVSKVSYSATTAYQTGNINTYGNTSNWNSNTRIIGGHPIVSTCVYTFYTQWNEAQNAFIITGFEKPPLRCDMPHAR